MTTHKDRPHHIDCQSKYFSETPEFPGQRLRCTCGEGTRDVYCAWSSDFAGLQGIATFFARLQPAVAAQHRFRNPRKTMPGWSPWQPCKVSASPPWTIDSVGYEVEYQPLYASPVTPAAHEESALLRIASALRKAGADLPAPENNGSIESAMNNGLCIALCLVEEELLGLCAIAGDSGGAK